MSATPNIKDELLNLSIKSDFGTLAKYSKQQITDALNDAGYEDFRIIENNIDQTNKRLADHPVPGGLVTLKHIQGTIRDIKATLGKSNEIVVFADKKDINALVTNPKSHMPALVQGDDNSIVSGFNTGLKVIRSFTSGNTGEDSRKNSKEAIAFTGYFRKEYDETYRDLPLQERFSKAYNLVFGETGILLTKTHNLQYGDIIDLNNPIYALVLLTATSEDEIALVEAIREEVVIEKNNKRFDKTLFLQRCEDDLQELLGSILALDVLSIIIPSKELVSTTNEQGESVGNKMVDVVNISENQKKRILQNVGFNKFTFRNAQTGKQLSQGDSETKNITEQYVPDL